VNEKELVERMTKREENKKKKKVEEKTDVTFRP
jgi:hypothetical protein